MSIGSEALAQLGAGAGLAAAALPAMGGVAAGRGWLSAPRWGWEGGAAPATPSPG